MNAYSAIAGRIRQALADRERVVGRAEALLGKAQRSGDDGYGDGVALNLLRELTDELRGCYAAVIRDLEAFAGFLDRLSQASGGAGGEKGKEA
jgi:hypothetical protein